jgi:hypothetical protein
LRDSSAVSLTRDDFAFTFGRTFDLATFNLLNTPAWR